MVPCSNIWLNSKVKQAVWIFFVTSWWIVLIRVVMMCRALAFSMRTVDSPSLRLPSKSWPADRLLPRVSQWNWPWARLTRIQPGLAEIAVVNRTLNPSETSSMFPLWVRTARLTVTCMSGQPCPPAAKATPCHIPNYPRISQDIPVPGYPDLWLIPGYPGISRDGQVVLGYARIRFL